VVLTLEAVPGAASNLVVPLPPSAIDSDQVEQAGAALRAQLGLPGQRYWALLLGGDGAGYRYTQADWLCLAALVNTLARRHDIRWLLVSSRRSGQRAEGLLKQHVETTALAAACWYQDGGDYQVDAWLGAAERLFVTEDSMTMLTEAACARRPVHSLRPATAAPAQRFEQALQRFAAQGWLCRHRIAELADHVEALDVQQCQALAASPNQWLADQLRERLGLS
jgi:mitochondrial fission protein ELM1